MKQVTFNFGDIVTLPSGTITTIIDWTYSKYRFKDYLHLCNGNIDLMGESCIKEGARLSTQEEKLIYFNYIHKLLIKKKK